MQTPPPEFRTLPPDLNKFLLSVSDEIWYLDLFWDGIYYITHIFYPKFRPLLSNFTSRFWKFSHCPIKIKFGTNVELFFDGICDVCTF